MICSLVLWQVGITGYLEWRFAAVRRMEACIHKQGAILASDLLHERAQLRYPIYERTNLRLY